MASINPPSSLPTECEITPKQFARVAQVLHEHAGIRMREGKEGLVRARLAKRLRLLGLPDFEAYLDFVEQEPSRREFAEMIDALTTNKTSFLREASHFDFLRDTVFPRLTGPVRIWSAGCSSGEEPYTLAMLCHDSFADIATRDVRILATDLSHRVLATAKAGAYPAETMSDVPATWLQKYWSRVRDAQGRDVWEAGKSLRRLVHFAKLNLMERWPMQGPFDVILCRNVMIYFDKATQQQLVDRYWALLRPGGYLFVGHSESLTGLTHQFRYVQPAAYVK
ncbi:MAG: protein-glutamate O-methyltransferase CheR [Gemmatimonadota bacterium]|jgi:chemotaxis protein methyltransferase CheR|nr:protein-glutamate O-methyltransferase CheR [Gemmatimonadota bacterium]MDQ8167094.1 protein-glutamate O-methyltransferase CheR [Gemmatimonadota bacterium]MDQ8171145.1 protein-glutamate O-methyltransferase CheR [Gemmatimonadota bacterium]